VQDRPAVKGPEFGAEFLGYLSAEGVFGALTGQDVAAREVPHVRIPPAARRPVTEQHLVVPPQDRGNDVVVLHRSSMALAACQWA
jgi:hypothetical protein